MGSKLKQIIYTSQSIDKITYQQIEAINHSSVAHNQQYNITGLLLYTDKKFIQIIEGKEKNIDYLFFDRIKNSNFHHSIEIVSESPIIEKRFSSWSMNYFVLEQAFFETEPCMKRKYLQHLGQDTLYKDEFLLFSLLYDIHAYIINQSTIKSASKV